MRSTRSSDPPLTTNLAHWLRAAWACARHEFRLLVHAPLTVIFQVWFLLALAIGIFLVADFYATDLASFDLQWTFLPWVAVVMAPALAMRAFAEGTGDRSLELTLSLPIPAGAIVAGKWLAGTFVLIATLAMTFPFALTVAYLGDPDWGVALSGYLGAALMLSACYALALLAASLTRDYVAAYVAGLAILVVVLLFGWDTAVRALQGAGSGSPLAGLIHLSPKHWLDRMAEGRIELAALTYFALLIGFALTGTTLMLQRRRLARSSTAETVKAVCISAMAVAAAAVVLLLAARLPYALDATAEQEFTLHPETRAVAAEAPRGITVDFYYSRNEEQIPASIRLHAQRVSNTLQQIANSANGRIGLRRHRTVEDGEEEAAALAAGVRRVPMTSGDSFVLGAVFRFAPDPASQSDGPDGEREGVIAYFDEARAALLEYDLALAIDTLGRTKTPRIGLLSPLLRAQNAREPREGLAVLEDFKRHYDVAVIPHFDDGLPDGLDALIVVDAPILKQSMLRDIDSHVMAGRGLIAMIDPYPRFNRANAEIDPAPGEDINDISDLLARYGARYLGSNVVGDGRLAALVTGADGRQLNYPYWLRTPRSALSSAHPVTASLNELLFAEAGGFDLDGDKGAVPLVTTGNLSATRDRNDFKGADPEKLAAGFKSDGEGARVIAAAVSGPLKSAYPLQNGKVAQTRPSGGGGGGDVVQGDGPSNVFVIADADWLFDPMALQAVSVGDRTITRPLNDNAALLLNMAEFATGNSRLIGIRSRGGVRRPFTRVAAMLKASAERYRSEEASYVTRISKVEENIAQVLTATGAKSIEQLPDNLAAQIRELRSQLLPFKRELRSIRRSMREDVERLGFRLTVANLFAGPLLALLFSALIIFYRRRRNS